MEDDLDVFLREIFISFQISTFLDSKFEEAGRTAISSKKVFQISSRDSLKSSQNRCLGVVLGGLGASWGGLGACCGVLGRPGGVLGASWGYLRASWSGLWSSWGRLGGV